MNPINLLADVRPLFSRVAGRRPPPVLRHFTWSRRTPPARAWRRVLALLVLGVLGLGTVREARAAEPRVFITEVMALNRRTVLDEDRHPSDWLELYNAGTEPVNLNGWHLTDSPDKLDRWTFPETRLSAGEYLLVFASGKNRSVAGKELHTNFKLGTGGEYLALVQPDGRTIAMQYKPGFPRLRPDVSYGIPVRSTMERLISYETSKWVKVPGGDPGPGWMGLSVSPAGWDVGKGGVGFDGGTNLLPWLGADIGPKMRGRSASVLVRVPFVVTNPAQDRLVLRMYYDDGFVAWLNGEEILRRNVPDGANWQSVALRSRGTALPVNVAEDFEGEEPRYVLMNGDPAARARVSASNPDTNHFLRLVNGRLPEQFNGVCFPQATAGSVRSVKCDFDFRIKGGGGLENDLYLALIPTRQYGAQGPGVIPTQFRGPDVESKDLLVVHLEVGAGGRTSAIRVHANGVRLAENQVSDQSLGWRFYHRAYVELTYTAEGAYLSMKVRTDSRGTTGHEVGVAERMFLPGVKPFPARLEVAGHTRTALVTMDLDNLKAEWLPAAESLNDDVDITARRSLLRPGTNVLAVLGLNRAAEDPTFLVLPELYGFTTRLDLASPRYFSPATPLAANTDEGFVGVAPPPVLTPRGGPIKGNTTVTLQAPGEGGVVRYTTDGREPTESSPEYTGPIPVRSTTILKAATFMPGRLSSSAVMGTFTAVDGDIGDFSSNLPLLVVNPQGRVRYQNRKTPVSVLVYDPGKGGGRVTLGSEPEYDGRGDMNVRGFSSQRYPKKSYTLRLRDEYGEKTKAALGGLPKESDWVLYGPFPDKTLIRDALAYDLSRAMGHYAPRTRFVELFMNASGGGLSWNDYQGVYVLAEKIKRGKNRVDIQELGPGDNEEPNISGGYIFRRDHSNKAAPTFMSSRGGEFFLVEPDADEATPQQKEWLERRWHELERAIYGRNFMDPEKGYRKLLDVPSFIDQHWLVEMSKNIDGFRYSVYFSMDRGGKVKLEPVWDWNLSFGNANYMDGESTHGWYHENLRDSEIAWFRRLSQDPQFNQAAVDRWWELRRGPFKTETVLRRVDELAAQVREAQARNFRRWQILGQWVHPNAYVGSTYNEEVDWMKRWIRERLAWIDSQLPRPPKQPPKPAG